MATYRRFHKDLHALSPVMRGRIQSGASERPQLVEAIQWHTGDDTRGLADRWIEQLTDGDYIVVDFPAHPYVWKQADFEENTELIPEP